MQEKAGIQENTREKEEKNRNAFWKIDKEMLPYKIHFFLFVGAMGALLPYHPSIGITRLKLGAGNLALVFTVQQFLFIVFKPIIGYIADYFNNLKTMILVLTIINGILSYLLLVIPAIDDPYISARNESQLGSETIFCNSCHILNEVRKRIDLLPDSTMMNEIIGKGIPCDDKDIQETLIIHCAQTIMSSPPAYDVAFMTCSLLPEKVGEESYLYHNSINILYITVGHNYSLSRFSVMCPVGGNYTGLEKVNLTIAYVMETCYKHPLEKRTELGLMGLSKNISCNHLELKNEAKSETRESDSFKTYQFWLYTLFLIISCACTSAIFTLSDTACYESVQVTGADYGKQRAWGAVSWGLMAPFSGFLNDYTDSYLTAMVLMTILCLLQTWNLYKMKLVKPQLSQNILKDVKVVLSSPEFVAFDVGVLFNGMGIGIVWFYLAWFVNDIGGSRLLLGLAHTVQCFLGEMPFMLISGWLIKRVGHFNVISMSLAAHCVRFLAYSSLKNPWMILPIECLDGITFGLFYTAMTSYGKLSSKPGTEATTQSLLCSTYEGLGAGLGCVIAGICFDYYGGYTTFFYAGLCFAVATSINISSTLLLRFRKGSLEIMRESESVKVRY